MGSASFFSPFCSVISFDPKAKGHLEICVNSYQMSTPCLQTVFFKKGFKGTTRAGYHKVTLEKMNFKGKRWKLPISALPLVS